MRRLCRRSGSATIAAQNNAVRIIIRKFNQKFGVLVMIITDGEFLNGLTASDNAREEQVEARVESTWQDIVTAPRDGQWFG